MSDALFSWISAFQEIPERRVAVGGVVVVSQGGKEKKTLKGSIFLSKALMPSRGKKNRLG